MEAARGIAWGVIVLYGPDAFALNVGSLDDDDPHPGPGVRTIYLDPFGDGEVEDLGYLYDRGLVVGAAQRVLALVVNFWDALDRKREMPIIPAAREVYYRDAHGQTWDLATRVPDRFDPTAYEWGAWPAMAGFWPGASLLWPVYERGRLTALPSCLQGNSCPRTGGDPCVSFGIRTGRCPGLWAGRCPGLRAVGPVRSGRHSCLSSTGQAASPRGNWFGSSPMGRHTATWGCMRRENPTTDGWYAGCGTCSWPHCAWPGTNHGSPISSPSDPLASHAAPSDPGTFPGTRPKGPEGISAHGHLRQECRAAGGGGGSGYGPSPHDLLAKRRPVGSTWRAKGCVPLLRGGGGPCRKWSRRSASPPNPCP